MFTNSSSFKLNPKIFENVKFKLLLELSCSAGYWDFKDINAHILRQLVVA